MDLIILVDKTPHLYQKTPLGLTKLEILKSLTLKIIEEIQKHKNIKLGFFDSDIYKKQNFQSLSSLNNYEHIKSEVKNLKISYNSNLIESLLFLLSFHNFTKINNKSENLIGQRELNNLSPILILIIGTFSEQNEKNLQISNLIEKLKWDQNLFFVDISQNENNFNDLFDFIKPNPNLKSLIMKLNEYKHIFFKFLCFNDTIFLLDILLTTLNNKIFKISFININKKFRALEKPCYLELFFDKLLVKSIYKDFKFSNNFISNFTYFFQIPEFSLPEDFFYLQKENIIKDLFLSIDYYNFPIYYIDFKYFYVKKKNFNFESNKVILFQYQIKDDFVDYFTLIKDKFGKFKNICFPIFYRNFNYNSLNFFGLYSINLNTNKIFFEIEYFPISFFEMNFFFEKKDFQNLNNTFQILPEWQKLYYKNYYKKKNVKLKKENIVISIKNQPFFQIKDFNIFFEYQNSVFNTVLERKMELFISFQKNIENFSKQHTLKSCEICFKEKKKKKLF